MVQPFVTTRNYFLSFAFTFRNASYSLASKSLYFSSDIKTLRLCVSSKNAFSVSQCPWQPIFLSVHRKHGLFFIVSPPNCQLQRCLFASRPLYQTPKVPRLNRLFFVLTSERVVAFLCTDRFRQTALRLLRVAWNTF